LPPTKCPRPRARQTNYEERIWEKWAFVNGKLRNRGKGKQASSTADFGIKSIAGLDAVWVDTLATVIAPRPEHGFLLR